MMALHVEIARPKGSTTKQVSDLGQMVQQGGTLGNYDLLLIGILCLHASTHCLRVLLRQVASSRVDMSQRHIPTHRTFSRAALA